MTGGSRDVRPVVLWLVVRDSVPEPIHLRPGRSRIWQPSRSEGTAMAAAVRSVGAPVVAALVIPDLARQPRRLAVHRRTRLPPESMGFPSGPSVIAAVRAAAKHSQLRRPHLHLDRIRLVVARAEGEPCAAVEAFAPRQFQWVRQTVAVIFGDNVVEWVLAPHHSASPPNTRLSRSLSSNHRSSREHSGV